MSRIRLVAFSVIALVGASAAIASAANISTKQMLIKDSTNAAKRQVLLQSTDPAVQFSAAGDPATNGASVHVYSATDDFCVILAGGSSWANKKGKTWKYKNAGTKDTAQLKNGKLLVGIKSGVTFTLAEGKQGTVNALVQFGTGTRFCMRCSGAKKDDAKKFLAKNCAAAACDPEPSACGAAPTTTTTTNAGTTSTIGGTTTTLAAGSITLKGALTATPGRFNYNLTVGLPGANAACNTSFTGTHACSYAELQNVEASGGLVGLKDTGNNVVTAFWAIDSSAPALQQCNDDTPVTGSKLNWEYPTAHTVSRGEKVALDNATGALGSLQMNLQCNFSSAWVGCCQ